MAIVIIDGFDHYPTERDGDIRFHEVEGYNYAAGDDGIFVMPSDRFGNQGKMLASTGGDNLKISNNSWWVDGRIVLSFAIKFEDGVTDCPFLYLYSSSSNNTSQMKFERDYATGELVVYRGTQDFLARSTELLQTDTWYWMEIKAYVNDTGTVEIQVDGTSTGWINISADTAYYSSADIMINMILFRGDTNQYSSAMTYFDDLVIQDDNATNTFIGDSRITTLFPRTDTATIDLATYPNTGDDNAQFLNDEGLEGPSEDDYYVYSTTAGDEDIYNFDTIDNDDTIYGISLYWRSRKTSNAPRTAQCTVSANSQTGTARELATNYITYHDVFEYQDPSPGTEVDWTQTNVDASTFGLKIVS